MRDLPTGTVTFVFTDVEGSTRLLHELGAEAYAEALVEHRHAVREAFGRYGGVEIDTQGDAFFYAFTDAPSAVEATAAANAALANGPIRVRMGLHTGAPHLTEEGYVGEDVHRGARIAAAGHGGQVLVSASTAALVRDGLRDLGEHRLKDLSAPERIYQLGDHDFPPLKTLYRTNLPVPATPFLGREQEIADLRELLERDDVRLLTLTGPGGTGKTRLALQAAADAAERYPDGVFWVPLAPLNEAALVLEQAVQAVDAKTPLAEFIGDKRLLLLFDNFEHVIGAAADLSLLQASCPGLDLLVTSRELLVLPGEQAYPVPPLMPEEGTALFLARARAVRPDFQPDETVHELCRRLDNLPLALELAAARTRVLSPGQLLERLSGRLDLLRAGRGADPRQQTLRATIEWSHDLLDEEEQRLFARFAVFAGGCTLEDAEAVADADLDTLQSLVDKSLVRMREGNRFWMLETIREFAHERFEASEEAGELRRRHADHYLALVPRHGWAGSGPQSIASEGGESTEELERLERDLDNIRAAISWLQDSGDADRLLRLTHALYWTFLYIRGRITEARPMLEAALFVAGGTDPGIRADVLTTVAILTGEAGEHEPARRLAAESLELAQSLDHSARIARALRTLARYQEEPAERRRLLLECETLAREADDHWSLAWVASLLGVDAAEAGDWTEGWLRLNQALESFNRLGSAHALETLGDLGLVAAADGRYDEARDLIRDAIRGALEHGLRNFVLPCLEAAAALAIASGAPQAAARLLGAAAAQREAQGEYLMYRIFVEKVESDCRDALGARFEEFVESGRALSFEEAVELALATTERG